MSDGHDSRPTPLDDVRVVEISDRIVLTVPEESLRAHEEWIKGEVLAVDVRDPEAVERLARAAVDLVVAVDPDRDGVADSSNYLAFPHAVAPSPHLSAVMTLPERSTSSGGDRSGRRRRARGDKEES